MNFLELIPSDLQPTLSISLGIILLVILFVKNYGNNGKHLPPGPRGLPIFGYAPFMKGRLEEAFLTIGKRYGDVFYLKLGATPVVVLNSFDAIKEALVKNANIFAGRPQGFNIFNHIHDYKGVTVENGSSWAIQRKFVIAILRDFGMGGQNVEHQIQLEAESVVKEIANKHGSPFDVMYIITNATANIMSSLTFGKTHKYDDDEFRRLLTQILDNFQSLQHRSIEIILPWIRFIPKFSPIIRNVDGMKRSLIEFIQKRINEHISTYDENNMRDFTDAFLKEHFKRSNSTDVKVEPFDIPRLVANILTLFVAGTTTADTLYWAIKLLIMYPETQDKVHKEIDSIVGRDRCPSSTDKANMPYTDSFIMETQRFGDVVAVGLHRAPVASTTLNGYDIPKGTTIFSNLHAVHYDKKLWGDPENFRPERFIGEDGKAIRPEFLMPFQIGKRICIGESMARTELFLFLTTILQSFVLRSPKGVTQTITLEKRRARELIPFQICANSRR